MGKIKKIIGAFLHAPGRFDELAQRIADTNDRISGTELKIREEMNRMNAVWFTDQLCENREQLGRLNRGLSIAPTVWGDPERLEIDETAKVFTCFFNVNSGRIRIGEYTFAWSNVSLLTGSHDMQLTGELRRDAERTENGDIEIGKGVWLASGCTVIGPCRIGDNAVIAAGAVVTPGTEVPANTVWGGVPAKQIKTIEPAEMTTENPAVKEAFERSGGVLFADGWGERTPGVLAEPGHWLCKEKGKIITDRAEWEMMYQKNGIGKSTIRFDGPTGETEVELTVSEGTRMIRLPINEGELSEVRVTRLTREKIFVALKMTGKINEAEDDDEAAEIDIEKIMREIKEEAKKHKLCSSEVEF
jgi:hypothetical protein